MPTRCALTLQDTLLMVGPYGDSLELPIQEGTVLVTECDSVRILSGEQHELLRRVPDAQVDVFRIGSTAPGDSLGIRLRLYQLWVALECGSTAPCASCRCAGLTRLRRLWDWIDCTK